MLFFRYSFCLSLILYYKHFTQHICSDPCERRVLTGEKGETKHANARPLIGDVAELIDVRAILVVQVDLRLVLLVQRRVFASRCAPENDVLDARHKCREETRVERAELGEHVDLSGVLQRQTEFGDVKIGEARDLACRRLAICERFFFWLVALPARIPTRSL